MLSASLNKTFLSFLDTALEMVQLGTGSVVATADIKSAFRVCIVSPSNTGLLECMLFKICSIITSVYQ